MEDKDNALTKFYYFLFFLYIAVCVAVYETFKKYFPADPFLLHLQGKYDEALLAYEKLITMNKKKKGDEKKSDEELAIMSFNRGLIYRLLKNNVMATRHFIVAKNNGCTLNPLEYSGRLPARLESS